MSTKKIFFIILGQILLPLSVLWAEGGDLVRSPTGGFIPVQDAETVSQKMGLDLPSPNGPRELIPEKESSPLSPVDPGMELINKTLLAHPELNDLVMTLKSHDRDYFYQMAFQFMSEWVLSEDQQTDSSLTVMGQQLRDKLVSWQETNLREGQTSGQETSRAPGTRSFLDALARYVARQAVRDARKAAQDTIAQAAKRASRSSYREHLQDLEKSRQESAGKHKKPSTSGLSVEALFHPSSETKDLRLLIGQLSSVLALTESAGTSHPWIRWLEGARDTQHWIDHQRLRGEVLSALNAVPRAAEESKKIQKNDSEKIRKLFKKILQWRTEVLKDEHSRDTSDLHKIALPPV